jgi:two-component system, NtrC family, sensor histidine kinase HydH
MKVVNPPVAGALASASLTTRFALYSFLCIGAMTVALWFLVSNYLINQILEHEWQATAQIVRADVRKFLEAYDFKAQDRKAVGPKFAALSEHMRLAPDIVRFKVYSPTAVVLWADDKRLVGKSFSENPQLQQALRGKVVAARSASIEPKPQSVGAKSSGDVIEVYVPIFADDGRNLLGVFETFKRADAIQRDVRDARLVVLAGALGGGLLLYLALFVIVRQAARKLDEQQLNLLKMQSELIASQRMAAVGEMAAAVAHGIGNPLSSIRAAAQVAMLESNTEMDAPANGGIQKTLQSILQQVDRVQKRMQGLLNFAKPMEPHATPVEINSLVRDVVETLSTRFSNADVNAILQLGEDLPKLYLDANQMEQVFMGLITNAIEATSRGGQVTVRTKVLANNGNIHAVAVSIEDTGEGIPVENRERVFEPFFTTKPHGTGIGLPLAKKFVERNGGTIALSETATVGTTINLTLPCTKADAKCDTPRVSDSSDGATSMDRQM